MLSESSVIWTAKLSNCIGFWCSVSDGVTRKRRTPVILQQTWSLLELTVNISCFLISHDDDDVELYSNLINVANIMKVQGWPYLVMDGQFWSTTQWKKRLQCLKGRYALQCLKDGYYLNIEYQILSKPALIRLSSCSHCVYCISTLCAIFQIVKSVHDIDWILWDLELVDPIYNFTPY